MNRPSPNSIKVLIVFAAIYCLFLYVGEKIGGKSGIFYGFILATMASVAVYIFATKMIIKLFRAKEVLSIDEPVLHSICAYLCENANLYKPTLYVIEDPTPNALSVGLFPQGASIMVTRGLLKLLDKDELAAVVAHELAYIQKGSILIATLASGLGVGLAYLGNFLYSVLMFGAGRNYTKDKGHSIIARFLLNMVGPLVAMIIQVTLVRNRLFEADEQGVYMVGEAEHLINALVKIEKARQNFMFDVVEANPSTSHLFIVNPVHSKLSFYLFSTHPSINERLGYLEDLNI